MLNLYFLNNIVFSFFKSQILQPKVKAFPVIMLKTHLNANKYKSI